MTEPLLDVRSLHVSFSTGRTLLGRRGLSFDAVHDVSFTIAAGETFGLVGESGSGKSTTGRAILRLLEPRAGTIVFDGADLASYGKRTPMWYRRAVQIVFQDPLSSLNPRRSVGQVLRAALDRRGGNADTSPRDVTQLLERVGLSAEHVERLPSELSGGQRQRVAIARAVAMEPRLIVCDEAVSALDVSTQSQVVNLLEDLQEDLGISYLFIAHDLSIVNHVSDRVGVMYLGRLLETGPADAVYSNPLHPYTYRLLEAVPVPDPAIQRERRTRRKGVPATEPPSPLNPPSGCEYRTRCPLAMDVCAVEEPPTRFAGSQAYRCHLEPSEVIEGMAQVSGGVGQDRSATR